jgi:plasmid stability protein
MSKAEIGGGLGHGEWAARTGNGSSKESIAFIAINASIDSMPTLTIRQLDDRTKARLRLRAAHHGHSMEQEAREILRAALSSSSPAKGNLAESVQRRFAALGGVELELPERDGLRPAARFDR